MYVKDLCVIGNWRDIADAARTTINLNKGDKFVHPDWKYKMLKAEHSPIRLMEIDWEWEDIPYWVAMHFARHHVGVEKFISTQRTDRTNIDRDVLPQNNPVRFRMRANAQSMINISRKRLCNQASEKTREAWKLVLDELKYIEPELFDVCVPECVYRGFCPELKSCGYVNTKEYNNKREHYIKCGRR